MVGKLSPTIAFKAFDCQILPILEYGSDIWYTGDDVNDLEKIHLKFIKSTLGVRKQTPTPAIYGDTGRFPLIIRQHIKAVKYWCRILKLSQSQGGGPRVVVSTAAFHARVRGSVPGLGGLKETKMFLPHPRVKVSIVGSLRDREVACSASDRQGANFESCVWRTVSSQSSHHPQEVLLAQCSLYVLKGGLRPDSFHFIYLRAIQSEMPTICFLS